MHGLQAVQNVVSTRTTLPILSNVLLEAEGDRLKLTATDLDVTVTCSVEASVKKGGATTVPVSSTPVMPWIMTSAPAGRAMPSATSVAMTLQSAPVSTTNWNGPAVPIITGMVIRMSRSRRVR